MAAKQPTTNYENQIKILQDTQKKLKETLFEYTLACEKEAKKQRANIIETKKRENESEHDLTKLQAIIRRFSNNLECESRKLNTELSTVKFLRHEIYYLVFERKHFNAIWNHLHSQIKQKQKLVTTKLEKNAANNESCDNMAERLRFMGQKSKSDYYAFTQRVQYFQRQIDITNETHMFFNSKTHKRLAKRSNANANVEREADLERQLNERYMQTYQMLLEKFASKGSTDELEQLYLKNDDENYALFCYINELYNEVAALKLTVDEIIEQNVIKCFQDDNNSKESIGNIAILQQQKQELVNTIEKQNSDAAETTDELNSLIIGAQKLFDILNQ